MLTLLQRLGQLLLRILARLGRMMLFLLTSLYLMLLPPYHPGRILRQMHFLGARSLTVIILTASFTGMVLGLQGYYTLRKFGAEALLGPAVALTLIRELGPVLAALMVTARAGSAMTAEIGIMRITEQIDALHAMGINPVKFLMAPRLLAALVSVPLLTAIFNVIGIYGGYLVGVNLLGISPGTYFDEIEHSVGWSDVRGGILKSFCFALLIIWVCGYKGYTAGYGAEGVSRATTEAVVLTSVLILAGDYALTSFLI
ncbi:MAG: ABC transporter permease [Deltaproteobacteria bacterium]|nr:ABC transporter permease [Deltaproteobacteria bacterium]MBI3077523.1 ABC transporter permease [Deltaproteobacteria bacterium]